MRSLAFALLLAVSLLACGDDDSGGESGTGDVSDGQDDAATDDTQTVDDARPPGDTRPGDDSGDPDAPPNDVADDAGEARVSTCLDSNPRAVDDAYVPDGYCATLWSAGLGQPRGIVAAPNGDILVVDRSANRVLALFDSDGDGLSGDAERVVLATAPNIVHGLAVHDGLLYSSSETTVYRWAYDGLERSALGTPEVVIHSIPGGGHITRTLLFAPDGLLYVSVGSAGNVDRDSSRARIRRFDVADLPNDGLAFDTGEVFADGLRNEVGLALDDQGRIWGVENGFDNAFRADLGGDIHNDNPAEELNLFAEAGRFYGYPYCFSEFLLPEGVGGGPGTQWAHEDFQDDGTHTDAWCQNPDNVVPPMLAMQAHSAPLDVTFYSGRSYPNEGDGDAFVAFHGSWNRDVPTGYKVVRVQFADGAPTGTESFFEYAGDGDISGAWPHRPVGIAFDTDGAMYVTSDRSGVVIRIGYTR